MEGVDMPGFVSRQPNGKLCRFSTIIDTVTHYNMADEEYIQLCVDDARAQAKRTIESNLRPFEDVKNYFRPTNMPNAEFDEMLKAMGDVGLFDYSNTEPIDVVTADMYEENYSVNTENDKDTENDNVDEKQE